MLFRSSAFIRAAKRLVKKNAISQEELRIALEQIQEDVYHAGLRTHKLKGELEGSWACSIGYDLRIVFSFVQVEGEEAILLKAIGTHDEVY